VVIKVRSFMNSQRCIIFIVYAMAKLCHKVESWTEGKEKIFECSF